MAILLIIAGVVACVLALWLARGEQHEKSEKREKWAYAHEDEKAQISIRETSTLHGALTIEGEIVD